MSDVDDNSLCICGGWPMTKRTLSIPLGMHLEELAQRAMAWVIKSAGVVGGRILSGFSPLRAFRAAFTLHPFFSSSIFSTIICFGVWLDTWLSHFLFLFNDISWTLMMTQTTVTSLFYYTPHPHTHT